MDRQETGPNIMWRGKEIIYKELPKKLNFTELLAPFPQKIPDQAERVHAQCETTAASFERCLLSNANATFCRSLSSSSTRGCLIAGIVK